MIFPDAPVAEPPGFSRTLLSDPVAVSLSVLAFRYLAPLAQKAFPGSFRGIFPPCSFRSRSCFSGGCLPALPVGFFLSALFDLCPDLRRFCNRSKLEPLHDPVDPGSVLFLDHHIDHPIYAPFRVPHCTVQNPVPLRLCDKLFQVALFYGIHRQRFPGTDKGFQPCPPLGLFLFFQYRIQNDRKLFCPGSCDL